LFVEYQVPEGPSYTGQVRKISRAQWNELEDAAWDWNPIGVPRNQFTAGEYWCLVEQVVPLLQAGATVPEIVEHFDRFFLEHFGLGLTPGAEKFARTALSWWDRVRS
jgi:hypothetical protein